MESMEATTLTARNIHARYRISWTAYLAIFLLLLISLAAGLAVYEYLNRTIGLIVCGLVALFFLHRIFMLYSVMLYIDDDGVWVYSGIFPWSRGSNGVKWRDLEEAVYFPNFFSWIFRSYTVRLTQRFTHEGQILLRSVYQGNKAVERINLFHRDLLANQQYADQNK